MIVTRPTATGPWTFEYAMETAPRDGRSLLVVFDEGSFGVVKYDEYGEPLFWTTDGENPICHWLDSDGSTFYHGTCIEGWAEIYPVKGIDNENSER